MKVKTLEQVKATTVQSYGWLSIAPVADLHSILIDWAVIAF